MTAPSVSTQLQPHARASVDRARFVRKTLEAVCSRGAGLPRGYFCSVCPP